MDLSDREALADQLLFLTGMNNFLGLQGMSKALVGELARNPDLAEDLRQEILEAEKGGTSPLDLARIASLKKMDRFLKEVMRLHPPVFFIYGRAADQFVLDSGSGPFVIDKDTHMMAVIPVAQTDPLIFDDPERFDPERFLDKDLERYLIWPHGGHNDDVSATTHICPGKDVAMLYGKMLCHKLVGSYTWKLAEPPEWDERKFSLNVASPKGDMPIEQFAAKPD
jgi:cytochrome P450